MCQRKSGIRGYAVPGQLRHQSLWPVAKQFIDQLNGFGNVCFTFFDEHSCSEGNMGDHFLQFFKNRGALWMNWLHPPNGG